MRGVRDQLALRADRVVERRPRFLQALEHLVEARRELPHLVVGVDGDRRLRSSVSPTICAVRDLGERRHHPASGHPAERGGERDPGEEHEHEDQTQSGQDVVDPPSGRAS